MPWKLCTPCMILFLPLFISIQDSPGSAPYRYPTPAEIGSIPIPDGYKRISISPQSFGSWLRQVPLKKDNTVYLYNGKRKPNQQAQYAVLDISVGKKDLQQCADAVMRLRAEFLYNNKRYDEIRFSDNLNKWYNSPVNCSRAQFEIYLEKVFTYCGTLSLEKQLRKVNGFENLQPGDVIIKGGSPGHAVIVMDVAENNAGDKIFLLAQSYMPAQDIHVLKNPANPDLSPWYSTRKIAPLITPEWVFSPASLKSW